MADTKALMTKEQAQRALTNPVGSKDTLVSLLKGMSSQLEDVIPKTMGKYLTPERIIRTLTLATQRTPKLLECTGLSIMTSVMTAAELGLEVNSPLEHAYLVPRKNKHTQRMEAGLIIGYKGYLELARRTNAISSITAQVIHEGDVFDFNLASAEIPIHRIDLDKDSGPWQAAYCIAHFKDGTHSSPTLMKKKEVLAIRDRSQARDNGPWVTDIEEMAKKTAIRRARKLWPLSAEDQTILQKAEDVDSDRDEESSAAMLETMGEALGEAQARLEAAAQVQAQAEDPLAKKLAEEQAKRSEAPPPEREALPPEEPKHTFDSAAQEAPKPAGNRRGAVIDGRVPELIQTAYDRGWGTRVVEAALMECGINRNDKRTWAVDRVKRFEGMVNEVATERQPGDDDPGPQDTGELPLD